MEIKIADKIIGEKYPPFIIAEAGVNHNGDLKLAKKLVDAAKNAGADAVKFQTFKTEELVTKKTIKAEYQGKGNQFNLLKKLELKEDEFIELKEYCDKKEIIFLSTPHTEESINFLDGLVPLFKLGSGDLTNIPFLKKVAKKNKPIILSTGMGTLKEIKIAFEIIKKYNPNLIILHCTTNYPCQKKDVNLNAMLTIKKEFNCLVGYSDHTLGITIPLIATQFGASVIEKHFTLNKKMPGPDHKASLNQKELKQMIRNIRNKEYLKLDEIIMGSKEKRPTKEELKIAKLVRKSIVSKKIIPSGSILTKKVFSIKRPGTGIQPKDIKKILGKKITRSIKEDCPITWKDIKMPKIFVASFNRASDGAISLLLKKMEEKNILTFNHKKADFILAVGDRKETFDFVLKMFQKNKRIIHLWAGEISQGTHDEVYRHAITLMSKIQLCTNHQAKERVVKLCKSIEKKPKTYVIGNIMLDNLRVSERKVPKESYDLILYNPPTSLSKKEILKELKYIKKLLTKKYVWIEPNGDPGSELIEPYVTNKNMSRPDFLGLMKNCNKFITNSSCMYYEAPFLLKEKQIIAIGKRNIDRESKNADMTIKDASDNVIKIMEELK